MKRFVLPSLVVLLAGCAIFQSVSRYDQNTLQNAMTLKTEALSVMEASISTEQPISNAVVAAKELRSRMDAAVAYEKGKGPANDKTYKQWQLLSNPNGHLLGGFITLFLATPHVQDVTFIGTLENEISACFDTIITTESSKLQ